ncbi:MAG TPA: amidohydrolase [Chloroflexi bacterium]|nr:amidohydrolase [Chloroflexota bacterium]HHW85038.1 amidohydrolase family protein [Chloroflexota bacterium]
MIILPDFLIDNPGQPPRKHWGVRVTGDVIAAVAPNDELRRHFPDDERVDAPGCTLSPGFVNAHAHLYGLLAHGLPLDKAPSGFWPFLEDFWWPLVEDRLDHEAICAATDAILLEMLRSGVTTVYDCTEAPHALPGCLAAQAEVVRRRGIRAILSFEATERVSPENGQLGLRENADFIRACRERGGLISGLMCFHTTFSCSAAFIQQAHRLGEELDVLVHMHCSEGVHEPEYALQHFGVRPMAYYDRLGVANARMLASQCVQMSDAEIAIMAARGVKMTHMPLSNCEVGAGIAPVPELVDAGVTVGLGSDGYVNDFYEVVRATFLIHKAHKQDPRVMPASLVWHLATEGGARALGLEKVGRIAAGWQADLQLIDTHMPTPTEVHNLYDQLVLWRNHSHVRLVMVAGQVRVRDGVVLGADEAAIIARAHAAARRLWSLAT